MGVCVWCDDVIDESPLLTPSPDPFRVMSQDDVIDVSPRVMSQDDVINVSPLLTPDPLRGYESGRVHVCVPLLTPTPSGL